jgi:maleylpyruvate isomerase
VTADPLVLITEVDRATGRLLDTAARLTDRDIAGASRLPGWTRGHVLTHLARNADGLTNLLSWARTGVRTPQYASWDKRNADIEAGAPRAAAEQVEDLRAAIGRFSAAAEQMPAEAWAVELDTEPRQPAAGVIWRRLREVEVHHVDLDAGYEPADWPDAFSHRLLHDIMATLGKRADAPAVALHAVDLGHALPFGAAGEVPTVTGPAYAIAGWLSGRSRGDELTLDPPGPLPEPPPWI